MSWFYFVGCGFVPVHQSVDLPSTSSIRTLQLDFSLDPKPHRVFRPDLAHGIERTKFVIFLIKVNEFILCSLQFVVPRLSDLAMTNIILPTSCGPWSHAWRSVGEAGVGGVEEFQPALDWALKRYFLSQRKLRRQIKIKLLAQLCVALILWYWG